MPSIADQLKNSIRDCGLSANALARETGIPQPVITRFLNGKDMKVTTADKLAAYFGLELRPAEGKKRAKKKT